MIVSAAVMGLFLFSSKQQLLTTQDKSALFFNLVDNKDLKAHRNAARLLDHQSAVSFLKDFMNSGRENGIINAGFTENQSKRRWCCYSISSALCNQSL